jgi:transcriptional regulator with XRE-family HTH domain
MMNGKNFGTTTRARRRALDLAQQDVAAAVNLSVVSISKIERGVARVTLADRKGIDAFLREREAVSAQVDASTRWRRSRSKP